VAARISKDLSDGNERSGPSVPEWRPPSENIGRVYLTPGTCDIGCGQLNRGWSGRSRTRRKFSRSFYPVRVKCTDAGSVKLQISRGLGKFVLQNWSLRAFSPHIPGLGRKCALTNAVSARGYSTPCMAALSARQLPSGNRRRELGAQYLETRMLRARVGTE
jgi:hypothetical protein